MTLDHVQFEPEVEELLREIAADPRSSLLRVARPKAVRGLLERMRASVAMAGLSNAERHLLQVHRCDVAQLLRQAAWKRLVESDIGQITVCRTQSDGTQLEVSSARSIQRRVVRARTTSDFALEAAEGFELLERCVAEDTGGWPSVQQLAASSLRLEYSTTAQINSAVQELNEGHVDVARFAFGAAIDATECADQEAACLVGLAELNARAGNPGGALDLYEAAVRTCPTAPDVRFSALATSFQVADEPRVLLHDRALRDLPRSWISLLAWLQSSVRASRARGFWQPSQASKIVARRLRGRLSPVGEELADVFMQA